MSSRKDLERICNALMLEFASFTATRLGTRLTPAQIEWLRSRVTLALETAAELRIPPALSEPWQDEDTHPGRRSAFPKAPKHS